MQLQTGVVSFAPTTIIFNAGKARIRGVEVAAFAELLRGLTLSLSYSHLDTKLLKQDDHRRDVLAAGRSEEHTSELQSLMRISYAAFCLNTQHLTRRHDAANSDTTSLTTSHN